MIKKKTLRIWMIRLIVILIVVSLLMAGLVVIFK
jgi:hypothetical protein